MQLKINSYVTIDNKHVIRALADADEYTLQQLGLAKVHETEMVVRRPPPDEARQTPTIEHVITAASRGDLPEFIERARQFLDEQGVFVRTDRLLAKLREVAHA
ncbi:hypothetical protein ACVCL3_15945 [Rhodanobacter sp. UC4437_H4]